MGARAGGGATWTAGLTQGARAYVKQAMKEGATKAQALKVAQNYNDWFEPNGDIALPF